MIDHIISEFGGAAALAQALGMPGNDIGAKAVRAWKRRRSIPSKWFAAIAREAAKRNLPGITVDALATQAEAASRGGCLSNVAA